MGMNAGGFAGVLGLARLVGTAQVGEQLLPWSVVVKRSRKPDTTQDPWGTAHTPSALNYWQREILAYQSGILTELAGNLVAPRCYAVTEAPHGEWRIWLEDIQESPKEWTLARYGSAARHLGHFSGAYLTGYPLPPEQPWTYRGRSRDWIAWAHTLVAPFRRYADTVQGRRGLSEQSVERIEGLLAKAHRLQAQIDRLPLCLCHHDAHRRNLLARDQSATETQTVAIDWSAFGVGAVGAEIGVLTAVTLSWLDVAGEQARELDQIIFDSYLTGLHDMGWQGDPRLARFGYTATAALVVGVAGAIISSALFWSTEEQVRNYEAIVGYNQDEILYQLAMVEPFLLDLGDEAVTLMNNLK